jgi:glucose/arabinose dehydrogenase
MGILSVMSRWLLAFLAVPSFGGLILNSPTVNTSLFTVNTFATGVGFAYSMQSLPDGSLAVLSSPGFGAGSILRFTDTNHDAVADGPPTVLYSSPTGPLTGLTKIGNYYAVGNFGDHTITLLKPGATPSSPWTTAGTFSFNYPADSEHPTVGITARATPGSPGSYDLIFNVGSEFNNQLSTSPVGLTGLATATLSGDSLYSVTIDETGSTPTASNVRQIATGIRNVAGMQFDAAGNFYFTDNAIDGPGADGDEPPQADELNRILAADFGLDQNFGYPTCYISYRTGDQLGSGCVDPLVAFQPIPNGTPLGSESEGPVEIAFSPSSFPAGYNNGIFITFSGKGNLGPTNEENAIVYYDFGTGQYIHFSENSQPEVGALLGALSTPDGLFITDGTTGTVYEITSAAAPEPASLGLCAVALIAGYKLLKRKARA